MKNHTCSIQGCDRKYRARGYCSSHLNKLDRYGDAEGGRATRNHEPLDFLLSILDSEPTMECIEWPFAGRHYGRISIGGKQRNASAAILLIRSGLAENPEGMVACHLPYFCNNPACVNPMHLRWDTRVGNSADYAVDQRWERKQASEGEE